MIEVIRHIEYLLLRNDRVAVPGLGCFTIRYGEARWLPDGVSLLPPVRHLGFEAGDGRDNELLVRSIMRGGARSRQEAEQYIGEAVARMRGAIETEGLCLFGRLGKFLYDKGELVFRPGENTSVENPRFGFAPLTLVPRVETLVVQTEDSDRIYISFSRRTLRAVSVAAAVIVFVLTLSLPVHTPDAASHYAGVWSTEWLSAQESGGATDTVASKEELERVTLAEDSEALPGREFAETPPIRQEARANYYIIVASLPNRSQAEAQITCFRQQGVTTSLQIYETAERSRLYAAAFETFDAARSYLNQLVADQPLFANAWIMRGSE